jgi:DNA polymerase-3 subunit beta
MRIQVLQENLLRGLVRAGRVVPSKPQLPIIQNVLLTTESGRLKITATNLETTETLLIGAKVIEDGGICVPSRLISEYVSSLPQDTVDMSVVDGALQIQCSGYTATIPGVSASEYPLVPQAAVKQPIVMEKAQAIKNLNRVVFSAATDEGRPVLTGVRIVENGPEMVFAATDGYRLSVKKQSIDSTQGLDLLVPSRAVSEVLKIATEEKETEAILLSLQKDNQLLFGIGDIEIRTRLIDGEYPNYNRIIPQKHNTRVLFDRESLLKAVKSASIFARDSANIIRLHIQAQQVIVSANTPQLGEDKIIVEAKVEGEGGEMAFNSRFLLEFLSTIQEPEIIFEMTGSLNPGVFKLPTDETYLHIIMPVRLT